MKLIGFIFIAAGTAVLVFFVYNYFKNRDTVLSPIPEDKGVKVIFVTPAR
jgi:hypothetical protein